MQFYTNVTIMKYSNITIIWYSNVTIMWNFNVTMMWHSNVTIMCDSVCPVQFYTNVPLILLQWYLTDDVVHPS